MAQQQRATRALQRNLRQPAVLDVAAHPGVCGGAERLANEVADEVAARHDELVVILGALWWLKIGRPGLTRLNRPLRQIKRGNSAL